MIDDSPTQVETPRRWTFSLRTLFFIVTCAAVFFAGFRIAGPQGDRIVFGSLFLTFFLSIWFRLKGKLHLANVLVGLFLVLAFLSLPTLVYLGHSGESRMLCENNLRQIGLALRSYCSKSGSFPPAYVADATGKPLCSWRGVITPELEEYGDLYKNLRLGDPWNSPNNSSLAGGTSPYIYLCPSDRRPMTFTSYLAVVGPNTAWPGARGRKLAEFKNLTKTILLIEVPNSGINWLEPRDVTVEQLKNGLRGLIPSGGSSPHPEGFNVLFADDHVETLPENIDPAELAAMVNANPTDASAK